MLFYHIDKHHSLSAGTILRVDDNGFSAHGNVFWADYDVDDRLIHWFCEHFFEQVRLKEFPERPSRFESFFACTAEYLREWKEILENGSGCVDKPWVWLVEADEFFFAEEGYLRSHKENVNTKQKRLCPLWARENARTYWGGVPGIETVKDYSSLRQFQLQPSCPVEVLLKAPIKVVRQLSDDEIERLCT